MNLFSKPEIEITLDLHFFFFQNETQTFSLKIFSQEIASFIKKISQSQKENGTSFGGIY